MLDKYYIDFCIYCPKYIISEKEVITIPERGESDVLVLKHGDIRFYVEFHRKSRHPDYFTVLLKLPNDNRRLAALDLIGPPHLNPIKSRDKYSGKLIPTPHLHIAISQKKEMAYPVNDKYGKLYLNKKEQTNRKMALIKFLQYCTVMNLNEYSFVEKKEGM